MDVTREQLARALATTRLGIEQAEEWRFGPTALPSRPDDLARALLAKIGAGPDDAPEPHDEVVDAHICCEHADTDPELAAMAALLPAVPLLQRLGYDARVRVIDWYGRRVNDGQPPF